GRRARRPRGGVAEMGDLVRQQVKEGEAEAMKLAPGGGPPRVATGTPARRDEEQVRKAVAAYGEAEALLRPAADLLRGAGPFTDEVAERARQARLELVEAQLDLYALNRRCLEAGADWQADDEEKRKEAIKRGNETQRAWDKLIK